MKVTQAEIQWNKFFCSGSSSGNGLMPP